MVVDLLMLKSVTATTFCPKIPGIPEGGRPKKEPSSKRIGLKGKISGAEKFCSPMRDPPPAPARPPVCLVELKLIVASSFSLSVAL